MTILLINPQVLSLNTALHYAVCSVPSNNKSKDMNMNIGKHSFIQDLTIQLRKSSRAHMKKRILACQNCHIFYFASPKNIDTNHPVFTFSTIDHLIIEFLKQPSAHSSTEQNIVLPQSLNESKVKQKPHVNMENFERC